MSRARMVPLVLGTALLTTSCGLSLHNLPLGRAVGGESYQVTAEFRDVSNLPIGGAVKIGQATIGRVNEVSTKDFQAEVRLDLDEDVRLPRDVTARLELTSALGEQFVVLDPPQRADPQRLADGDTIPLTSTSRGPDPENTLAALGTVLGGSGLDQARTIVTELNTALGGREQKVRDLLHRLDTLLSEVDRHRQDFDVTIDSLHRLSADTAANTPVLESALTDITPAVDVLLSQRRQFERLLTNVTALGRSANGVVRQAGPEFTRQVDQLRPVLNSLAGFDGHLTNTLTQLRTLELRLGGAIPGDYLNLDGTLDVSGTLLPLLTGHNPPVPVQPPAPANLPGPAAVPAPPGQGALPGLPKQPVPPGPAAQLLTGGTR